MKQRSQTFTPYKLLRPFLFNISPETAHSLANCAGKMATAFPPTSVMLGSYYGVKDSRLESNVFGVTFPNPVGLAAGFDKKAELVDLMRNLGFGFTEVGSVTAKGTEGNSLPRLFRLPKDKALINRMGLNNPGPEVFLSNLNKQKKKIPVGINIAKTNDNTLTGDKALQDMIDCFKAVDEASKDFAAYYVLNVSCPNTEDGKTFEEPESLDELLSAVFETSPSAPVLVKFSSDTELVDLGSLLSVCEAHDVAGYVATNTSNSRNGLNTPASTLESIGRGGLSGPPLFLKALERVNFIYNRLEGKKPIIAVGGVDSAVAAYELICAGASLIQVYTALVYEGPGLPKRINKGLLRLLENDGFSNISEAVGSQ